MTISIHIYIFIYCTQHRDEQKRRLSPTPLPRTSHTTAPFEFHFAQEADTVEQKCEQNRYNRAGTKWQRQKSQEAITGARESVTHPPSIITAQLHSALPPTAPQHRKTEKNKNKTEHTKWEIKL